MSANLIHGLRLTNAEHFRWLVGGRLPGGIVVRRKTSNETVLADIIRPYRFRQTYLRMLLALPLTEAIAEAREVRAEIRTGKSLRQLALNFGKGGAAS